ncbi:MAG: BamA/TamA family outer membrane protein [Endomicrobia bacterium]|nr:BamA/TamA family outer membrane protein [Endomicrobiia bacterium]MCL2800108.1 BamA/TamA family outer membrane protein [Endomicrobiia bacterium]
MTRFIKLFTALSVIISSYGLLYAQTASSERLQSDIWGGSIELPESQTAASKRLQSDNTVDTSDADDAQPTFSERLQSDIQNELIKLYNAQSKPSEKLKSDNIVDTSDTDNAQAKPSEKLKSDSIVDNTSDRDNAYDILSERLQYGLWGGSIELPDAQTTPSERLQAEINSDERSSYLEQKYRKNKREKAQKREKFNKQLEKIGISEEEIKDKDDEKIIMLKEIKFSVSDILPQKFFYEIKKRYENTKVSINDIYSIVTKINNEYMLRGYISSQAFLSEQDISSGNLFINLVEGIVDKVTVDGNKTTKEKYIRKYIKFDKVDNLNAIDTNMRVMKFNAENDAKARVVLAPGRVFGTSDVNLIIDEPERYSLNVFGDNAGQKETGLYRGGFFGTVRSITGYRDIFNLGGVFSEGSKALFTSYEIPEPLLGTRVGVGYDYSDTQIVNGILETLEVKGDYYNVYLYVKKPFYIRENTVSNMTFNVVTRKGASYISGYQTQSTKTDLMSLNADNSFMTSFGYIYNSLTYAQGMKLIEGETNFEKISYYGEFYAALLKYFGFNFKLKGQAAFENVPSSEQFSMGGSNSVRGYSEGMIMGKDGINASAELQYNLSLPKIKWVNFTRLFLFGDYGIVYPGSNANLPDDYEQSIYSIGAGLKFGLFQHFDAGVTWAFPLGAHKYYDIDPSRILFIVSARI